MSATAWF